MNGTHTSKKKRNVPHLHRQKSDGYVPGQKYHWVCEHGSHCAHGVSAVNARNWFRVIYGY